MLEGKSFAGRLGGDEFVIFLRKDADWDSAHDRLKKILDALNAVELGEMHGIQASLGVVDLAPGDKDIDSAYTRADRVLYDAKKNGKNQIIKG